MAMIRAAYKRTFQMQPYETQVVELAIEEEVEFDGRAGTARAQQQAAYSAALYKQLEEVGDAVMADAFAKPDPRQQTSDKPRVEGRGERPTTPRPRVPILGRRP